ncbi:MAG: transposase [Candidatus Tectomicrobia bacterium]
MSQGKELTYEQKQAMVHVKKYMDHEKGQGKFISTANPALRTARALNFSLSTVKNVLSGANNNQGVVQRTERKPRGHGAPKVGSHEIALVRRMIQDAYLRGELVTIPKLRYWLKEKQIFVTYFSLRRALLRNGFYFGKAYRRNALKERDDVIANRRKYLALLRANRTPTGLTICPEVYMDETFVNVNHRKQLTWNEEGSLVNVPSGVGARLIIVDAIIQDDQAGTYGWVKGAHLHFKSGRRTGDYHGAMQTENFTKWMTAQLLPHVPRHSLIILDNAPYHNTLTEDTFPQSESKKAELHQWLVDRNIPFEEWLLKPALYDLCRQHAPPPQYVIDDLAAAFGCEILRTPQYHPELQPIEHAWGIVKSHMADTQTGDYTLTSLQERLVPAFQKVTPETCQRIFAHVRKEEDRYWKVDEKLDEMKTE